METNRPELMRLKKCFFANGLCAKPVWFTEHNRKDKELVLTVGAYKSINGASV